MRKYIMTDRERDFVEKFLETGEVAEEDYITYTQLRHQFRNAQEVLTMDLATLEIFIQTTRKPKCFGTEDVVKNTTLRKCTQCESAAKCMGEWYRKTKQ